MLVVSRKMGEKICIGDDIVITLIQNRHGVIKVGIEAPREVKVLRSELVGKPDNVQLIAQKRKECERRREG